MLDKSSLEVAVSVPGLHWSKIVSKHLSLDLRHDLSEEIIPFEHSSSEGFCRSFSFEVIHMTAYQLSKPICLHTIDEDIVHAVVDLSKDSSFCNKGSSTEKMIDGSFNNVRAGRQCILGFMVDFIDDNLVRVGYDRVVSLFWSGCRFQFLFFTFSIYLACVVPFSPFGPVHKQSLRICEPFSLLHIAAG